MYSISNKGVITYTYFPKKINYENKNVKMITKVLLVTQANRTIINTLTLSLNNRGLTFYSKLNVSRYHL